MPIRLSINFYGKEVVKVNPEKGAGLTKVATEVPKFELQYIFEIEYNDSSFGDDYDYYDRNRDDDYDDEGYDYRDYYGPQYSSNSGHSFCSGYDITNSI